MFGSDPVGAFKFKVIIGPELKGNFSKVSGLETEITIEEVYEGGVNNGPHYMPTNMRHSRLVLERGIMNLNPLEIWFNSIELGIYTKLPGMIMLMNNSGLPKKIWAFKGAYPVKYIGPELDAKSSEIAVTRMEIIHDGLVIVPI